MPRTVLSALALCLAATASADEGDFVRLFDGKSLDGWTTEKGQPVTKGWVVEDGTLHRNERGGQIVSAREFDRFELHFDWKVETRGNSGVKYRLIPFNNRFWGCEYQLLDDENHPNAKKESTSAGALYQLAEPKKDKKLNPAGEWNSSKIVVDGPRVEHWLNGELIVKVEVGSDQWKERLSRSKYRNVKGFGEPRKTKILLQDHGNKVWFREIKVRELE